MHMPRVNCKYFKEGGYCSKKPRTCFRIFSALCCESGFNFTKNCEIKEINKRPAAPPNSGQGSKKKIPTVNVHLDGMEIKQIGNNDLAIMIKLYHNYYVACHGHLKGIARLKRREEKLLCRIQCLKMDLKKVTGLQDLGNTQDLLTKLTALEDSNKQLEKELTDAESDSEVQEILNGALDKHKQLHEQIGRIISASDDEQETILSSREDALAAIHGLLGIMPKKRNAMLAISDHTERQKELERLTTALEEALESAKSHGLKEETRSIQNEIESVASLNGAAHTENT